MNKYYLYGIFFLILIGSVIAVANNVANLDMVLQTPINNNVANIEFLEGTTNSCTGLTTCNHPCGTNFTGSVNMNLNILNFTGTETTYLLGNITNATTKIGQCNIKLNGMRLN